MKSYDSLFPSSKRIFLDYPLDILLNRKCLIKDYDKNLRKLLFDYTENKISDIPLKGIIGGVALPDQEHPGTGNILIQGRPGTGKSILALQMAVASTIFPNDNSSIFFSLEEHMDSVIQRCDSFGWKQYVRPVAFLDRVEDSSSPKEIAAELKILLSQTDDKTTKDRGESNQRAQSQSHNQNGEGFHPPKTRPQATSATNSPAPDAHAENKIIKIPNKVLLATLSPRSVAAKRTAHNALFFERLRQIEKFLIGAKWLRNHPHDDPHKEYPDIRLVCIDSLTVFGDDPLSREELYQLFTLFRRNDVIGVFTAEESAEMRCDDRANIMDYLADVVIRLREEEENGYTLRFFEIRKSRFQHEIYGRHPLRMQTPGKSGTKKINNQSNDGEPTFFQALKIMPSVHHIMAATAGHEDNEENEKIQKPFDIGISAFKTILKRGLCKGSVVTIKGPLNSFKTTISRNFLLQGIYGYDSNNKIFTQKESALLIRMHDRISFFPKYGNKWMVSKYDDPENKIFFNPFAAENDFLRLDDFCESNPKFTVNVWAYEPENMQTGNEDPRDISPPRLVEIAFKSGAILPEEFLEIVRKIIHDHSIENIPNRKITRVVLNDVGLIGASYPFLRKSSTAGSLFLPAFVHIMRHYNVDLVMTGTTGQLTEADAAVDLASELADSILHCGFVDVFGDRYAIARGEGQTVSRTARMSSEFIPGVLITNDMKIFDVDMELLQGLVGFDTGTIHRPGITLQLFNEGEIHTQYNNEIEIMMRSAFSAPRELPKAERPSLSASIHNQSSAHREFRVTGSFSEDRRRVSIIRFSSDVSEAVHDSLGVLEGKPIDRTMICSIDEFFMGAGEISSSDDEGKGLIDVSEVIAKSKPKDERGDPRDNYLVSMGEGKIYGVPYYANVLLLAYREDILHFPDNVPSSWVEWEKALQDPKIKQDNLKKFDFDLIAEETLTCILLDAIASGCGLSDDPQQAQLPYRLNHTTQKDLHEWDYQRGYRIQNILTKGIPKKRKDRVHQELLALQSLFSSSEKYAIRDDIQENTLEANRYINDHSIMYVCWYSQLRDLLDRKPSLARKLRVASLPGYGFRGDFFLGIIKGSVSETLGGKVIELLCNRQEEYKRFVRGVGLPVTYRYYTEGASHPDDFRTWPTPKNILNKIEKDLPESGFLAWPSSKESLNKLLLMHRNALTRSRINGYRNFRPALYALSKMIAFADSDADIITRNCVDRLQYIINKLNK